MTPKPQSIPNYCFKPIRKSISVAVIVAFMSTSVHIPAQAQSLHLPPIGAMVHLSPQFNPAYLKGIVIHPENALKFDFIIYKGDDELTEQQKKDEYQKLIKYFLASLAIPDEDQWVNLSPYEKDRIIKDDFGKTEMGRDLLSQDYLLKQITSSLIYPEDNLGKKFWDKVYSTAQEQYGTTNIPVNTFNKVWIVPDDAMIYEKGNTAYVLKNHLRVMMEEDYLSLQKHAGIQSVPQKTNNIGSKIVKEIVLPELEKEVNEGKNFANLRQVFSGMVLAAWYKRALKESLLSKIYADQSKVKGVDQDPANNEAIYQQYLKAYKKGVFNFIKEDVNKYTNETIPRKYFSGGVNKDVYNKGIPGVMPPSLHVESTVKPSDAAMVQAERSREDLAQVAAEEEQVAGQRTKNQPKILDFDKAQLSRNAKITVNSNLIEMVSGLIHEASVYQDLSIEEWEKRVTRNASAAAKFDKFVSNYQKDKGLVITLLKNLFTNSGEASFKQFLEEYGLIQFHLERFKMSSDKSRKIISTVLAALNEFSPGAVEVFDYVPVSKEQRNVEAVLSDISGMYVVTMDTGSLKKFQGSEYRFFLAERDVTDDIKGALDTPNVPTVKVLFFPVKRSSEKKIQATFTIGKRQKIDLAQSAKTASQVDTAMSTVRKENFRNYLTVLEQRKNDFDEYRGIFNNSDISEIYGRNILEELIKSGILKEVSPTQVRFNFTVTKKIQDRILKIAGDERGNQIIKFLQEVIRKTFRQQARHDSRKLIELALFLTQTYEPVKNQSDLERLRKRAIELDYIIREHKNDIEETPENRAYLDLIGAIQDVLSSFREATDKKNLVASNIMLSVVKRRQIALAEQLKLLTKPPELISLSAAYDLLQEELKIVGWDKIGVRQKSDGLQFSAQIPQQSIPVEVNENNMEDWAKQIVAGATDGLRAEDIKFSRADNANWRISFSVLDKAMTIEGQHSIEGVRVEITKREGSSTGFMIAFWDQTMNRFGDARGFDPEKQFIELPQIIADQVGKSTIKNPFKQDSAMSSALETSRKLSDMIPELKKGSSSIRYDVGDYKILPLNAGQFLNLRRSGRLSDNDVLVTEKGTMIAVKDIKPNTFNAGVLIGAGIPLNRDGAMKTETVNRSDLGGIDFNAANLNLQIKRDGKGVPLPISQQNLENIHIDGLIPVILNIKPVLETPLLSELNVQPDSLAKS
jgi:hypothetical protein